MVEKLQKQNKAFTFTDPCVPVEVIPVKTEKLPRAQPIYARPMPTKVRGKGEPPEVVVLSQVEKMNNAHHVRCAEIMTGIRSKVVENLNKLREEKDH